MSNWRRQVHKLQIDITSHCNARCGACIRNIDGGETRPGLKLTNFNLDVWKRVVEHDTKGWYIKQLTLNGNWGDPMMHPDLVEMINFWTRYHPETSISIATNGSMRSLKFWKDLATVLRQASSHKIDFAVDGMEDTHHLYRRRTDFNKIIENIKSFNSGGGHSVVMMTMFEHNKHQIDQVRDLARSIGARSFVARRSFTGEREVIIKDKDESYSIKAYYPEEDKDIINDNDHYRTEFPENDMPMSDAKDGYIWMNINDIFEEVFTDHKPSKCPWKDEGEVQIDPWGTVWPCCHISLYGGGEASEYMYIKNEFNEQAVEDDLIGRAKRMNNLEEEKLGDILSNHWFNKTLNNAIDQAEWAVCRNNCGVCK